MSLDDEIIDRNPFEFELAKVLINNSVQRQAISEEQERRFLKFIKEDEHYYQDSKGYAR